MPIDPKSIFPVRWIIWSLAVFVSLGVVEAGVLALLNRGLPNQITTPFVSSLPVFQMLWTQNAWGALQMLAGQEVVVLRHVHSGSGLEVWGLYFYPLSVAVLATVSGAVGRVLSAGRRDKPRSGWLLAGAAALALAVTYVRVASCCSGPAWAVDVLLRALTAPYPGTALREALDGASQYAFLAVQILLALLGLVMLSNVRRRPQQPMCP